MNLEADFEPIGRRVACRQGDTLLGAAQGAAIGLNAPCGGEGTCGRCVVRIMHGEVSPPNGVEIDELGAERLATGWRLACQVEIHGAVCIHVPPESLATSQRTQTEGQSFPVALSPAVHAVEVTLPQPCLDDLRSDGARLRDALNIPNLSVPASLLPTLPSDLRANQFHVVAFIRQAEMDKASVVGLHKPGTPPLGLAIDLGTTKLAAYLFDLANGETLAAAGAMNPQIAFGEDVMARINHASTRPEGGEQLHATIVETLKALARDLCAQTG